MHVEVRREPSWPQFVAWACTGAACALGVAGALTIGPLAIVLAPVCAGIALLLGGANVSAFGAVAGPGLLCFAIGWLNRADMSPTPWYVVGTVFVVAAVTTYLVVRRGVR